MTAEDFASMNDAVIVMSSYLTDEEILMQNEDDEELVEPSKTDVENSLQIFKNFYYLVKKEVIKCKISLLNLKLY